MKANKEGRYAKSGVFRALTNEDLRRGFLHVIDGDGFDHSYDDWPSWKQERYELGRRMGAAYAFTGARRPTPETMGKLKIYLDQRSQDIHRYRTASGRVGHKKIPVQGRFISDCTNESKIGLESAD